MLPEQVLSTQPLPDPFYLPDGRQGGMLYDFEMGGIALNDPSQGIELQLWVCWVDRAGGVRVKPLATPGNGTLLFTEPGILRISFGFDNNMQASVAYEKTGEVKYYWFDSSTPGYVTTTYAGARTPRVSHDDKRYFRAGPSDVILTYLLDDKLYFRAQRDRYLVAYLLRSGLSQTLRLPNAGMNIRYRFQWELR